jgi:hypothetical protein
MPTLEEIFWDLLVLNGHNHLGPPWFHWTNASGHLPFQIYKGQNLVMLPFIQYQETNRDTYIMGTEGKDLPAHY